ncbi:unnamed protein product [Gordionus sp. m RMFG-2023]
MKGKDDGGFGKKSLLSTSHKNIGKGQSQIDSSDKEIECYTNVPWLDPKPCKIQEFTYYFWDGQNMHYYLKSQKSWWWYDYQHNKWIRDHYTSMERMLNADQGSPTPTFGSSDDHSKRIIDINVGKEHHSKSSTNEEKELDKKGKVANFIKKYEVSNLKTSHNIPASGRRQSVGSSKSSSSDLRIRSSINNLDFNIVEGKSRENLFDTKTHGYNDNLKNRVASGYKKSNSIVNVNYADQSIKISKTGKNYKSILIKSSFKDQSGLNYNHSTKVLKWDDKVKTYNYEPIGDNVSPTPLLIKDVHPNLLKDTGYTLEDYSKYYWESNCPQFVPYHLHPLSLNYPQNLHVMQHNLYNFQQNSNTLQPTMSHPNLNFYSSGASNRNDPAKNIQMYPSTSSSQDKRKG